MLEFLETIQNSHHFKVNDKKEGVLSLTPNQELRLNKFWRKFIQAFKENNIQICFRGENFRNLSEKLFNYNERSLTEFSSEFYRRCFMLGDKSKMHYMCNYNYNNPIPWSGEISKVRITDFDFIFSVMNYFVGIYNNEEWKKTNSEFITFFSNNDNRAILMSKMESCNTSQLLVLIDYFFWYLHKANDDRFKMHSCYDSTTTEYQTCKKFAYMNGEMNGPLAFLYYILKPINKLATCRETIYKAEMLLTDFQLPTLKTDINHDEFELSVKGGLFPHFIIGIYEFNENRFVLNHNLFRTENRSINHVLKSGIKIDQTYFFNYLKKSNYHHGIALSSDNNFHRISSKPEL